MAGKNQSKSTLRKKMRSALANKALADKLLDRLVEIQTKMNATLTKINADSVGALDTNYSALGAIPAANLIVTGAAVPGAPYKASMRRSFQRALAARGLANELLDSMVELQVSYNALLLKLDAEAGTLAGTNYSALLKVPAISASAKSTRPSPNNASARTILRASLANGSLADQFIDSIVALQSSLNSTLLKIDAHTINGQVAAFKVTVLDPESKV